MKLLDGTLVCDKCGEEIVWFYRVVSEQHHCSLCSVPMELERKERLKELRRRIIASEKKSYTSRMLQDEGKS